MHGFHANVKLTVPFALHRRSLPDSESDSLVSGTLCRGVKKLNPAQSRATSIIGPPSTLRTLLVQRRDSQQCGFSETIVSQENSSANSTGTTVEGVPQQYRHALNAGSGRHRGRRLPAQLIAARDARELGSVSHATGDAARSRAVELPNPTRSACRTLRNHATSLCATVEYKSYSECLGSSKTEGIQCAKNEVRSESPSSSRAR